MRITREFFVVIIVVSICFQACNSANKSPIMDSNLTILKVDPTKKYKPITSIIDSIQILNLDTSASSLLSDAWGIQKIIYQDSKYFIADCSFMSVKVFDSSGNYLFSLGSLGLEKGQYVRLEDIAYNSYTNSIFVLCNRPRKILQYNLQGLLIKEEQLGFFATSMEFPTPYSRIFYVNQNKSPLSEDMNLLITDTNNIIQKKFLKMPKNINSTVKFSGGLFQLDDGIYLNEAFSNIYFQLIGDSLKPVYKTDYLNKNVPAGIEKNKLFGALDDYSFQYNNFVKLKNEFIGFNFMKKNKLSAFYNLKSNELFTGDLSSDSLNVLFNGSLFVKDSSSIISVFDYPRNEDFLKRNVSTIVSKFPQFNTYLQQTGSKSNVALISIKLKQ